MHWNVIDYNKFLNIVFMHLNKQNFIIIPVGGINLS